MYVTGFTDEVSTDIEQQIEVCRYLGWKYIDLRTVGDWNVVDLPDDQFFKLERLLQRNDILVSSFGSRIANWSRSVSEPFNQDLADLERAIPRMKRLGVPYLRVMSYRPDDALSERENEDKIVRRLRDLATRAEEAGITLIHENCETWGGRSVEHTERLIQGVDSPAFKLVFDTGNPPATLDHRDGVPRGRYQDALEFYHRIKSEVVYIHIKDARPKDGEVVYTFPGEGNGRVGEILSALASEGYDGAISIEPHLAVVYHDPTVTADERERWDSFIEYARRSISINLLT